MIAISVVKNPDLLSIATALQLSGIKEVLVAAHGIEIREVDPLVAHLEERRLPRISNCMS